MRTLSILLVLAGCPGPEGGDPNADLDQDGHMADVDCADDDPLRFPGAVEVCNGLDDDCDGQLARNEADSDGDGTPDCRSCDDAGFWESTRQLEDAGVLEDELIALTSGLDTCDYTESRRYMFTRVDKVDGMVEGVYTGVLVPVSTAMPDGSLINTEHTWPQSEGADSIPARCDLHHLYPTDPDANAERGNLPFDVVTGSVIWQEGGSKHGYNSAGSEVFEPRDSHKGNVARSMFYFATVYGYTIPTSQAERFKQWDLQDPPDAREHARSMAIMEYQAHANPYAVCLGLGERVF
ncbi:MAG: endonuclease [Proteobacteria bacterium]|nr:endonuclease [Pseudomonadota bacterium]